MEPFRASHRIRKRILAFLRQEKAVSGVEFSFIAFPFLFLLFAIIETGYVFILAILLEGATADGAREIRTGVVQTSGNPKGTFETAICNGMYGMLTCSALNYDATTAATYAAISYSSPPPTGHGTIFNVGTQRDIVLVRVAYQWNFITPFLQNALGGSGVKNMMATVVIRNEDYP